MSTIITDDFRKNNAAAFVTDINTLATDSPITQATGYYVGIGKSDPWDDDNDPPTPTGSERERADARANLISFKLIESNEVERLLPKTNQTWTSGRLYKAYDPTDRTCFNQTLVGGSISQYSCYAISNGVLYLCLSNNAGGNSTVNPSTPAAADGDVGQNAGDDYIWTRIGVIPTASDFADSTTFFEIPANLSDSSPDNIDTKGLLFGFKVVDGGSGYSTTNGAKDATLRYTQLDGTTATAAVKINVTDGVVTSVGSATSSPEGEAIDLTEFQGFGVGASNGIRKASVHFDTEPSYTTRANIQPLFAPPGGFGDDNLDVFPPYYIGVAADFVGTDSTETLVDTKFRQVSIIKNVSFTANDSPEAQYDVQDSLSYFSITPTISLTADSGWYVEETTTNQKAWIDYIDTSAGDEKIYFHQNSGAQVTQDTFPASGTVEVFNASDISQGTFAYGSIVAPEHDDYSGEILLLNNRTPILRSDVQTEKVRLVLQF